MGIKLPYSKLTFTKVVNFPLFYFLGEHFRLLDYSLAVIKHETSSPEWDIWIQGMSEQCPVRPSTNQATLPGQPDSENYIHLFSKLSIFLWWAVVSQHVMLMSGFAGHNDSQLSIAHHKIIDPLEKLYGYNFPIRQPWRGCILHRISHFSPGQGW